MESEEKELWRSLGSYDENDDDWLQEELELEFVMRESLALAKLQGRYLYYIIIRWIVC